MTLQYIRNLPGREADFGKFRERRRRRSWLVLTDNRFYDEGIVIAEGTAAGIFPVPYFTTHPNDVLFLCKRIRSKQETKSPLHWIVDADYDTEPIATDEEDKPPLDRRAKITWNTVPYQKATEKDRTGKAIVNPAGDYFDPPIIKDLSRWTATVQKNLATVPTDVLSYRDKLNDAAFDLDGVTIPKNVAKIMAISIGDVLKEGPDEYRTLSFTLQFDETDKWKSKPLNQGFYFIDAANSNKKTRCKVNGKDCVSPQLLDTAGGQIATPTPASATFGSFDIYDEMDYGVLPTT